MILVDTNAWISHLRQKDRALVGFLLEGRVRTCEVIVGELLLGSGIPKGFVADLARLPQVPSPSAAETLEFVQRFQRSFSASGVGWADAQILLAASKAGARIYTADRAVRRLSSKLKVRVV